MTRGTDAVMQVAAAVIVAGGRVLVQTRPSGAHYEGYWEFPGGKTEAGESPADCAVRECSEELGVEVRAERELRIVRWSYPARTVDVTFVECRLADATCTPRPLDGQRIRWADARDLETLRFLPANAEVLADLVARLSSS